VTTEHLHAWVWVRGANQSSEAVRSLGEEDGISVFLFGRADATFWIQNVCWYRVLQVESDGE
jgi:hypothetical protein